jgi:hypothetical protein
MLLSLPRSTPAQTDLAWLIYRADVAALPAAELRVSDQGVTYRDPRGQRRTLALDQVAAILRVDSAATFLEHGRSSTFQLPEQVDDPGPAPDVAPPPPMQSLAGLIDGQVFRGRFSGEVSPAAESMLWDTPHFGTLIIPLERLLFVRIDDQTPLPSRASADVLTLANGDRLEGFVSRLNPSITVERSTGGVTELSHAQVAAIRFANPPTPTNAARAWLGDGTVVDVDALASEVDGERITLRLPSGQVADVPANEFLAARLMADRLVPLAQLEARAEPPRGRPWTPPLRRGDPAAVPLGLAEIELPGPMRVTWTLPRGASRLSLTAELPLDARLWGDATLTFSLDDAVLAAVRLSSAEPVHTVTLDLPNSDRADRALVATLDEGAFGPIQDRALLRRAVLLVTPAASR